MNSLERAVIVTAFAAITVPLAHIARAAPGLETFVMGTTGQSNYPTYGVPQPVDDQFSNFSNSLPTNPAGLAASGIAGGYRVQTSASALSLSDATAISGNGRSGFGNWNYSGSAATYASYGSLGAEAHAVHTGNSDNATVNNADAYAVVSDTINPSSPGVTVGSNGRMRLAVTVDGSLTVGGKGTAGMLLRYDYGTPSPGYPALGRSLLETFVDIYGNGYQIYGVHSSFGSFVTPPGVAYTFGPNDASGLPTYATFGGKTTVYADIPVTFGLSADFRLGMLAWAGVGNGSGMLDSGWRHTATITGIELFDNAGKPLPDFTLTSGSGTLYTVNGVQTVVPEPSALALFALASACLARRRAAL